MQSKKYTHNTIYTSFYVKFNFKHVCTYIGVVVMSIRKMGMVNENKNEYILHLHSYIHTYIHTCISKTRRSFASNYKRVPQTEKYD